jgi:predicted dehydrogenase
MIGAGTIAKGHAGAIQKNDNIRIAAVMDPDGGRAKELADESGATAYTSLEEILGDDGVQGVHVCSPHSFHADQVVAAATAGKHVLVEKPMALSVADCDRMIEACERADRVLMVGQVMRKYTANLKVRELIAQGAIGQVGHLIRRRYGYFDPTGPESPYGAWYLDVKIGGICVLYGFGTHEYDTMYWLLQSPVEKVYAQGSESTELYKGQKDSYSSIMNHENGAVSVLTQSAVCKPGAHDQYIVGSEGTIVVTGGKITLNGEEVPYEEDPRQGMIAQIGEFATCSLEGKEPDASGRSVRHTMAVIEAAMVSAERDAPVLVSEFD